MIYQCCYAAILLDKRDFWVKSLFEKSQFKVKKYGKKYKKLRNYAAEKREGKKNASIRSWSFTEK